MKRSRHQKSKQPRSIQRQEKQSEVLPTSRACLACKRGKRQCDGSRPCQRCIKMGIPCVDVMDRRSKAFRDHTRGSRSKSMNPFVVGMSGVENAAVRGLSSVQSSIMSIGAREAIRLAFPTSEAKPSSEPLSSSSGLLTARRGKGSKGKGEFVQVSASEGAISMGNSSALRIVDGLDGTWSLSERYEQSLLAPISLSDERDSAMELDANRSRGPSGGGEGVARNPVGVHSRLPMQRVARPMSMPQVTVQLDSRGSVMMMVRQDPMPPGLASLLGDKYKRTFFVPPAVEAAANRVLLPGGQQPAIPHYAKQLQFAYDLQMQDTLAMGELSASPVATIRCTQNLLTLQPVQLFMNIAALRLVCGEPDIHLAFGNHAIRMMDMTPLTSFAISIQHMSAIIGKQTESFVPTRLCRFFFLSDRAKVEVMEYLRLISEGAPVATAEKEALLSANNSGFKTGTDGVQGGSAAEGPSASADEVMRSSFGIETARKAALSSSAALGRASSGRDYGGKGHTDFIKRQSVRLPSESQRQPSFIAKRVVCIPYSQTIRMTLEWVGSAPRVFCGCIIPQEPFPRKEDYVEEIKALQQQTIDSPFLPWHSTHGGAGKAVADRGSSTRTQGQQGVGGSDLGSVLGNQLALLAAAGGGGTTSEGQNGFEQSRHCVDLAKTAAGSLSPISAGLGLRIAPSSQYEDAGQLASSTAGAASLSGIPSCANTARQQTPPDNPSADATKAYQSDGDISLDASVPGGRPTGSRTISPHLQSQDFLHSGSVLRASSPTLEDILQSDGSERAISEREEPSHSGLPFDVSPSDSLLSSELRFVDGNTSESYGLTDRDLGPGLSPSEARGGSIGEMSDDGASVGGRSDVSGLPPSKKMRYESSAASGQPSQSMQPDGGNKPRLHSEAAAGRPAVMQESAIGRTIFPASLHSRLDPVDLAMANRRVLLLYELESWQRDFQRKLHAPGSNMGAELFNALLGAFGGDLKYVASAPVKGS